MKKKVVVSILAVSALALAAFSGVLAYRSAHAAASPAAAFSQTSVSFPGGFGNFGRGFPGGASDEELAAALGITTDQLAAAYQKANQAALDQAVAKGLITQAQADQLKTNGSAFPFGGRWEGWLSANGIDYQALLADALGITVDKLQAAYTQAFNARVDQAVKDGRLSQDQADLVKGQHALFANAGFQTAMKSAFEAAVKQAVSSGVITQAQADQILKSQDDDFAPGGWFGKGMGGMFGAPEMGMDGRHGPRGGGPGGWGPFNPGNPGYPMPQVTPTQAPTGI